MFSRSILSRALVAVGTTRSGGQFTVMTNSFASNSTSQQQDDSSSEISSSNNNNNSEYYGETSLGGNNNGNNSGGGAGDENTILLTGSQLMRCRLPAKAEQFYFSKGDSICRLCNEFVPNQQVKFHLVGAGPRGPSTHMGREIVLDSLVYYGKLGYDPAHVMRSWAFTLLSHPQYVRLPELLPPDPTDLQARAQKTHELLLSLRNLKVIDIAVSPHSERAFSDRETRMAVKRRVAFERLECIGDNAWGSHLSGRMLLVFPDKKWAHCQMHHSFNTFRDLAETNTNLERMFDLLDIAELLPPASRSIVGDGKIKADIFEAILGELNCALYAHEANLWGTSEEYTELNDEHLARICIIIKHVLNEIFDLTLLCMMYLLGEHAIPIARELSFSQSISPAIPSRPAFDVGDTVRTRRPHFHKHYVPTFTLPQPMKLTPEENFLNSSHREHSQQQQQLNSLHFRSSNSNSKNLNKKSLQHQLFGPAVNSTPKAKCFPLWEEYLMNEDRIILEDEQFSAQPQKRQQEEVENEIENNNANNQNDNGSETSFRTITNQFVNEKIKKLTTTTTSIPGNNSSPQKNLPQTQPPLRLATEADLTSNNNNNQSTKEQQQQNITNQRFSSKEAILARVLDLSSPPSTTTQSRQYNTSGERQTSSSSSLLQYRNLCPFSQLSKFPPHSYNPYGLDSETWMARWMREEQRKEIFDDDVCDNIGTVIAQFEATAAFGSGGGSSSAASTSSSSSNSSKDQLQQQQKDKERRRNYPMLVDYVFERIENQDDDAAVGENAETNEGDASSSILSADLLDHQKRMSCVQDMILEYAHPFRNGVTVGSDGASFASISSSINDAVNRTSVFDEQQQGSFSSDAMEEEKLDIDEIKRRNAMITGKRF